MVIIEYLFMPRRFTRKRNKRASKRHYTVRLVGGEGEEERQGLLDKVGDQLGAVASSVLSKAEDAGLNALGLERKENETMAPSLERTEPPSEPGLLSTASNVVEKTSTAVLDNVNEVLNSQVVSSSVQEAGQETAAIASKLADTFNEALDNPVVQEKVEKAIEHAGEVGAVVVKAAEEPVKEAVRVGVEAGSKALGAAASGAIRVGTDMMAAVPGLGSVIEIGKMLNDGSKAASAVVEAGTEAVESASDAFLETSNKVKEGLQVLEANKAMANNIAHRTSQSIQQFEQPPSFLNASLGQSAPQQGGKGGKKRFTLFKRKKHKKVTKRVRFAV